MLTKFDIYRSLLELDGVYEYRGVDLIRPMKTKMYFFGFLKGFTFFMYSLFYKVSYNIKSPSDDKNVYIFYGNYVLNQKSTTDILNSFRQVTEGRCGEILLVERFDFIGFFSKFYLFLKNFLTSGGGGFFVALARTKVQKDVDELLPIVSGRNISKVITFCDAIGAENIVAQLSKVNGVNSYTMQHGQYRLLEAENFSQDIEAISNFVSDFLFCWGEATVREYLKYGFSKDQLIPVGRFMSGNLASSKNQEFDCFGVVFSGQNSKQDNYELLSFARDYSDRFGVGYYIKPHPSNDINEYSRYCNEKGVFLGFIENSKCYFDKVGFSIMAMTGFFIECIENQHNFFILDVLGLPEIFSANLPTVSSVDSCGDLFSRELNFLVMKKFFNDDENQKTVVLSSLFEE